MTTPRFRARLLNGDPLIGTWIKTPSPIIAEVLGLTPLDCVCLDTEHAPFDRLSLDTCISALRKADQPCLVRIPSLTPEHALNALDCGATGIVAPHIKSKDDAVALATMCRYGPGGRGYAGSTRAAGYTTSPMGKNLQYGTENTAVIAQIEDIEALDAIDTIAAVDGIDCLFIGRIDLTVALGATAPGDTIVVEAVEKICHAGSQAGRRVGMFVGVMQEIPKWRALGVSLFILKSDQAFLLDGAKRLRDDFDHLCTSTP